MLFLCIFKISILACLLRLHLQLSCFLQAPELDI
jgi:hypothetical protein